MRIILLRHGKVNYPPITMLSADSFKAWVADYDANELDVNSKPDDHAIEMATQADAVVCSALPRSVESAKYLQICDVTIVDSLFNEAGIPIANWRFPRLSVRIWAITFRLAWLFGYCRNSESCTEARTRASQAVDKLIAMANEYDSVLLVGHRIFNHFIAKELRARAWTGPKRPTKKYWQFGVFTWNSK